MVAGIMQDKNDVKFVRYTSHMRGYTVLAAGIG